MIQKNDMLETQLVTNVGQLRDALKDLPADLPLWISYSDSVESGTVLVCSNPDECEILGSADDV